MQRRCAYLVMVVCLAATIGVHVRATVTEVSLGFGLGAISTITSDSAEVISGKQSIKASYAGSQNNNVILATDSSLIPLAANRPYRVTFRFRILNTSSTSFFVSIFSTASSTAGAAGVPGQTFGGTAGTSGTFSMTRTLGNFSDYRVFWQVNAPGGTVVIDDIQIVQDDTNQVVAAEDGEGPRFSPGPLNFQVVDSQTFPRPKLPASETVNGPHSLTARDLDGDGTSELIVTLASGPNQVAQPPIILATTPTLSNITSNLFPGGVPLIHDSKRNLSVDLDGDGLKDLVIGDAGLDAPLFTGAGPSIALNIGRGTYRDVSPLVPPALQDMRTDSLATADLDGDGRVEILLPGDNKPHDPVLLRWTGGGFTPQQDWVDRSLLGPRPLLRAMAAADFADFDGDGKTDLVIGGGQQDPSFRMLFGSTGPFTGLITLPDGPFGHISSPPNAATPLVQGGDVGRDVVADFNNDGRPDVIGFEEQFVQVIPGAITDPNVPGYADLLKNGGSYYGDSALQVLLNDGGRHFTDNSAASSAQILGKWLLYWSPVAVDVNNDGFLDVVAVFQTKRYGSQPVGVLGTTFFLNDGTGAFQIVDGTQALPLETTNPRGNQRRNLGWFVPTSVAPDRTEGFIVDLAAHGALHDGTLDVYHIVANASIGTGPNFSDPSTLGVPGFNEFYYLRHYPDAAAAVRAGQFRSGLDHYIAIGAANGYRKSAPNNAIPQGVSLWSDDKGFRVTYQDDGNVVIYDANKKPMWFTNTAGVTGGTFVMQADGNLVLKDAQNVVRWQSSTTGNPGAYFGVQGDGNLIIYNASGTPIWGAYGH